MSSSLIAGVRGLHTSNHRRRPEDIRRDIELAKQQLERAQLEAARARRGLASLRAAQAFGSMWASVRVPLTVFTAAAIAVAGLLWLMSNPSLLFERPLVGRVVVYAGLLLAYPTGMMTAVISGISVIGALIYRFQLPSAIDTARHRYDDARRLEASELDALAKSRRELRTPFRPLSR